MPRVGVVLDGMVVPNWISHALAQLRAAAFLELALVVIAPPAPIGDRRSARRWFRRALFSAYEASDHRLFRRSPDAFQLVDESGRVGAELAVVEAKPGPGDEPFSGDDLELIKSKDLDVILWFPEPPPRGEILRCPKSGVWKLQHGDPELYRGGPPFFWEIYDGRTVTVTVLEVFSGRPDDRPKRVYRSTSAIHQQSLYQTRNAPYWKAAQFMLRCLERLAADGWDPLESDSGSQRHGQGTSEARGIPTNAQMVVFLFHLLGRAGRSRLRRLLYRERWFLGYRRRREPELEDGGRRCTIDMRGFAVVHASGGRSAADPFVLARDGRHHVFFEDIAANAVRGAISRFELLPDGSTTAPESVLTRPYHLSYPFLFAVGDSIYLLPETGSNGAIELYRAEAFPTQWQFERTLVSGVTAVDPTLLEHGGQLWLFANVKEYGAPYSDELNVYFADSLAGPWTPHPRNPVVSDVRSARPAGRIFDLGGMLIRPGQDSSERYGRAVTLNRIDVLTEVDYEETVIGSVDPSWRKGNLGTHTYNFDDLYEVVDGREWVFRLSSCGRWRQVLPFRHSGTDSRPL
jgi:hypothetical protein